MTFRISDLTLLSLGQQSSLLRVLRLAGCDQLTDVGLNWLAEGCKALEELDLGGCTRVSDRSQFTKSNNSPLCPMDTVTIFEGETKPHIGYNSISYIVNRVIIKTQSFFFVSGYHQVQKIF
jgi:hypothetical protein